MCDIQLYCLGCGLYTLRCAAEAMSIYITEPCVVRGRWIYRSSGLNRWPYICWVSFILDASSSCGLVV